MQAILLILGILCLYSSVRIDQKGNLGAAFSCLVSAHVHRFSMYRILHLLFCGRAYSQRIFPERTDGT